MASYNGGPSIGLIVKLVGIAIVLIILITIIANCFSTVDATERGVLVTWGKVSDEVLQPGIVGHAPFATEVRTVSMVPQQITMVFTESQNGAITKDMQTVGSNVQVIWKFEEARVLDIVKQYNRSIIENAIQQAAVASLKETIGDYTIYELVENQEKLSPKIQEILESKTSKYPIEIVQLTITDWDWSDAFDRQIQETMQKTQEVKKAQENLKLTQTNAQQQVAEAEARKQAAALVAEQEANTAKVRADQEYYAAQKKADEALYAAQQAAEAKKLEADSLAYYNSKVAQNYNVEIKLKELEIELTRAQRWDGRSVPNVLPMTASGTIVDVK